MLMVPAFALLVLAMIMLFALARRTRACWPVAALLAGAGFLFAIQWRSMHHTAEQLDVLIGKQCQALASALDTSLLEYRTITAEGSPWPPAEVLRLQDSYFAAFGARAQLLVLCVPELTSSTDCLPPDLDNRTVGRIERAARAIENRRHCDTR